MSGQIIITLRIKTTVALKLLLGNGSDG